MPKRNDVDLSEFVRIPGTNVCISKRCEVSGTGWEDTHFMLAEEGFFMPTPALVAKYLVGVNRAAKNRSRLYDGAGNPIDWYSSVKLLELVYGRNSNEKNIWTWLDAKFVEGSGYDGLDIETEHRVVRKRLVGKRKRLEKIVGKKHFSKGDNVCCVQLKFNDQGLPVKSSKEPRYKVAESMYFMHPREDDVLYYNTTMGPCLFGRGSYTSGRGTLKCLKVRK
ncbi:hypothetical protein KY343_00965 [Candidatus Woesearchaeota archaeon]|nr:hypothetical protein [Candidatus Woesearchaeota archaeon]